jgi:hypothetical protein
MRLILANLYSQVGYENPNGLPFSNAMSTCVHRIIKRVNSARREGAWYCGIHNTIVILTRKVRQLLAVRPTAQFNSKCHSELRKLKSV